MKTTLKRAALITGLLGAGTLLAYGPGLGVGFPGHHGWGGHLMSMGYGPLTFLDGDVDARLERIKTELAITPDQEDAWNAYTESLQSHVRSARAAHGARWTTDRSTALAEHDRIRESLWTQRQDLHTAAAKLIEALTENQRVKAGGLLSYGMHHFY